MLYRTIQGTRLFTNGSFVSMIIHVQFGVNQIYIFFIFIKFNIKTLSSDDDHLASPIDKKKTKNKNKTKQNKTNKQLFRRPLRIIATN